MQEWYQTREGIKNAVHRGLPLGGAKKVSLTSQQAALLNKQGEKVAKCDPPTSEAECVCLVEWQAFVASKRTSHAPEPKKERKAR